MILNIHRFLDQVLQLIHQKIILHNQNLIQKLIYAKDQHNPWINLKRQRSDII